MKGLFKLLLRFFVWLFWRNLHWGLKSVTGFKTLASANEHSWQLCRKIQKANGLNGDVSLSWENTENSREDFARYLTIRHFLEVGEVLALFRAVHIKKIVAGGNNGS